MQYNVEDNKRLDSGRSYNPGYLKYVGWDAVMQNTNIRALWNKENLVEYQKIIAEKARQFHPQNRPVLVSLDNIGSVLFQCYQSNRPKVGDIYSRYIMDNTELTRNDWNDIVERMMTVILNHIKSLYTTQESNRQLTVWNAMYGDFNAVGLRAHPEIKTRKNRPPMQFHMRY